MPHKILVVDDEPDVERLFPHIFRSKIKSGELSFEFAENGSVALEKLKTDTSIDIIFTDINMPVMDGLTLLAKIKEHDLIPKAVVISAYGDMKNIRVAMNLGAFDFITKPLDFDDLQTTLLKTIREMEILKQGIEAKSNLEKALIEKTEAQQQALQYLQEKEKLILHQNELLEQQVTDRTIQVIHQKELIEIKNKEILDSIHYAKRLQEAILPPAKLWNSYFPESFVYYQPKDIVAGDFYWIAEAETGEKGQETTGNFAPLVPRPSSLFLVAAADCTGHGVAGALMSMIGVSLLNQIVNEKGITTPSLILNQLHHSVIAALKQNENDSHDGMDIALCLFDFKNNVVQFAGANRQLWIVQNNEIKIILPDKVPIGGLQMERKDSFMNNPLTLTKNDTLYMFTDGYTDQFGGENGKKLMTKKLKEILLSIQHLNMHEQEKYLDDYFQKWKGNSEQVDDVLIMGIKV